MIFIKFKERLVVISMLLVFVLIIIATVFTWQNKNRIVETTLKKKEAELVKADLDLIFREHLRGMDLGLRGYALTKNKQVLSPYENALKANATNLVALDSLFRLQKLDSVLIEFGKIKAGINDYIEVTKKMKEAAESDSLNEFVRILNQDKGFDVWKLFSPFYNKTLKYEDAQIEKAEAEYKSALSWNVIIQFILLALSVPSVGYAIYKINKDTQDRNRLLYELNQNNRQYLFDSGNENNSTANLQQSIDQSIDNFKKATGFIKAISAKDFGAQWAGLNETNAQKNENTLAGELIKMRDQMKLAKQEDDQRFWMNEGLAQFSQLVRQNQSKLSELCTQATSYLAHYLNAQQGSLFIHNDENPDDDYLELVGRYAGGKNEATQKRIEIGSGLIGQAYKDSESVLLQDVPSSLAQISSGLGSSTPTSLCIIPLKFNNKTEAVLELAALHEFEPYMITFIEKAGEFIASAIINAKTASKMETMISETQQQTEEMRAQEEEMRQNMEELTATQEELHRQDSANKGMLDTAIHILNELPQKIFLKDENGKMVLTNSKVAEAHNMTVEELIGKSDFDFVDAKTAQEWRNQELEIIKKGKDTYTFDETLHGQTKTLTTVKMAFYIPHLKQTGLLGIQTDVTELEKLKKRVTKKSD